MKKYIRICLMVLLMTILFSSAAQAAQLGSRTLRVGMSGEDVSELQTLLKRLGYFNTNITGYYGNVTKSSVLSFQFAYGLNRDEIAGSKTIYKLKYENGVAADSYVRTRTLAKGMSGMDVQNLQVVLKSLGYLPASLNPTQYFGNLTHNAVLSFQKQNGLVCDGRVGAATASTINRALTQSGSKSANQVHVVQTGDTLWIISQKFGTTVAQLQQANGLKTTTIYAGQRLTIPAANSQGGQSSTDRGDNDRGQSVTISYQDYTVKAGDSIWSIANSYSIPQTELMKANGFNSSTILYIGQYVKIPVVNVPVKATPGSQYGELLDWWSEAQYVLKFNETFTITDFYTGAQFKAVRTFGANHADCEPLTSTDTSAILKLWNANHSSYWTPRPVIISINGRKLAASMTAAFHAGLDSAPNGAYVNNRSGDYGYGQNFDAIKGNGADGHFDIHFLNSTTHGTGVVNKNHQNAIRVSAGK
ncbi:MAG: LysM peptidoglycan-binding domain-containing protein [Clostridia bacterium]|nr:LysM peptidoglycan-binding domain-containing protein [Clostridia bacterium]